MTVSLLAVDAFCRSAWIRTFSTCVEYQKCPFNRHFHEIRAVFTQNVGTKLVLNCEININDARFLYWYSVCYASLNGSGVEPICNIKVCGALIIASPSFGYALEPGGLQGAIRCVDCKLRVIVRVIIVHNLLLSDQLCKCIWLLIVKQTQHPSIRQLVALTWRRHMRTWRCSRKECC